jgi:hypothetical protein
MHRDDDSKIEDILQWTSGEVFHPELTSIEALLRTYLWLVTGATFENDQEAHLR